MSTFTILGIVVAFSLMIGAVIGGTVAVVNWDKKKEHKHVWGKWVERTSPYADYQRRTCEECGFIEQRYCDVIRGKK